MDGATQVPQTDNPEDACPRVIGKGKHYFEWVDFISDEVQCINCGQRRNRTRSKDQVTFLGTTEFPAVPAGMDSPQPESPPLENHSEPVAEHIPPVYMAPIPEAAAPEGSFAGGGASGSFENPTRLTAVETQSMTSAPSVVADNTSSSDSYSSSDSGSSSSSSGSD